MKKSKKDTRRKMLVAYRGDRNQTEMAQKYGVSQQTWSVWENGSITPPPHIMKAIEDDSGIPMEEIFSDTFNRKTW